MPPRSLIHIAAGALLAIGSTLAHAGPASCGQEFMVGQPPALLNAKLAVNIHPLCFHGFATLFSGLTHTPLYSAEHLTADRVAAARSMVRVNSFHPEDRLPEGVRSELEDYRGSGYDRGHMAPNGDMGDAESQGDSFSLANMIPQNHANNAGIWAAIEEATRDTAAADGEVYVVTGPLFESADLQVLNGRVFVPTSIWKAVYDPVSGEAGAYLAKNEPGQAYRVLSITALATVTGVDPFPSLPASVKSAAPDLPAAGRRVRARD